MNYYFEVLKKYAVFSGRAQRKEYWMYVLFSLIIMVILSLISENLAGLYQLAVLIPNVAVGVRRMHDVNKSGWYLLIPIYNIILGCTDGTNGSNEYGGDPKTEEQNKKRVSDEFAREDIKLDERTNTKREQSDIKYCRHCGTKHAKDTRFCSSCGKSFA